MIQIENVSKNYGTVQILQNVTFSVAPGEVLGLFGPNGAGKTTLLNILALISKPDSGKYMFDSEDAFSNLKTVRPTIGYVPQDIALFEELTVKDNLLCWSRLSNREAKLRAEEISEALFLTEIYKKKIKHLSGGMKRRVNLAVALLNKPQAIIMDEPLAGVDTEHQASMITYLRELAQAGVTQIISGHSAEQLTPLVDTVMLLRKGQVVYWGDVGEADWSL